MNIKGKRILFGPPKSYSTTTYELLKRYPNIFYTMQYKEFVDYGSSNWNDIKNPSQTIIDTHEKYLDGYADLNKWFVDCSLYYYNSYHYKHLTAGPTSFDQDIMIYFIRNLYDVIKSRYIFIHLKGISDNLWSEVNVKDAIDSYDFAVFHDRIVNKIKYNGQVVLVQGFQLNNILTHVLNLDINVDETEIHNPQELHHDNITPKQLNDLNTKFLEEFDANKDYAMKIAINNIRLFDQYSMPFGFNETTYLKGLI